VVSDKVEFYSNEHMNVHVLKQCCQEFGQANDLCQEVSNMGEAAMMGIMFCTYAVLAQRKKW
jgi:hypothetical protein